MFAHDRNLFIKLPTLFHVLRFSNESENIGTLPASSTYYKTSVSKAKILNMVKEKIAEGEIINDDQADAELEEINGKKV